MEVVLAGSQTGTQEDYEVLRQMCNEGTVILDDSNPLELAKYSVEKDADLFIGGVKERPIAYKMGIGFCDHNHERKIPLVGFEGMVNFAKEVHGTVTSPVWDLVPRRQKPGRKGRCDMSLRKHKETPSYTATQNACKMCTPVRGHPGVPGH